MTASRADVTVAICTRARPALVARALESVRDLKLPPAEVLVVDNAPDDDRTREAARQVPGVRYIRENRPGLNHARNRAISESGTEITVFLDDDAQPQPGWIGFLEARFRSSKLGACVSHVKPYGPGTPGQRLFELAGGLSRGDQPVLLPRDHRRLLRGRRVPLVAWTVELGVGCGLALRTEAVRQTGGFDPVFGTRARLAGGDETDMLWRLLAGGWEVAYEPDAVVLHEHRAGVEAVSRQLCGYQRGTTAFLFKSLLRAPFAQKGPILLTLAWRTVKPLFRLVRRAFGRDPLPAGLLIRMGWHSLLGPVAYLAARASGRRGTSPDGSETN